MLEPLHAHTLWYLRFGVHNSQSVDTVETIRPKQQRRNDLKGSPYRRRFVFDGKYSTDTGGVRDIGTFDVVDAPAARYAVRYDPSSPELVRTQLANLKIGFERFTFIDFGSGKGRVLMLAAGFPFKEMIGVEFSRELHEIAVKNIARFPRSETRAGGCGASTMMQAHTNYRTRILFANFIILSNRRS